ncbi:efflux RND transporter periplasmic adaptor subunit [Oceanimonas doudoroffii]|uniref:Acriflavin resistance protein AcrA n=1 Tax=Oceanimonas doudoroffii TaxID=84158 RepID=A0A233RBJ4_9GAMM|nr:efflux RND transporter periplasmic adaptor subunit [Oceanimonas doudoroffii]OXY80757.1 acriflavin resistance protein AcrA [Oceanimonas doudoroffii]
MSKPIRCKELLLAALALTAWSGHADEYRAEAFQGEEYKARAVIKALDRAVLSGELAARVTQLPKRPGDSFRQGELLLGLDCSLYQAQADKVAAESKAARFKLDNAKQLNELRSIGSLDVALAQSEYAQAQAELRIARLNTERCQIKAPYDGRVVAVLVNRHENIRQQQEVLEIVADQRLEAEVVVPATWLGWLKPELPLTLRIDETGASVEAAVVAISPAIDPVSQTLQLRARLTQPSGLMPGMSASAYFTPAGAGEQS